MKRKGASIIFINERREILLFLRDEKPELPFPGHWDVPGGHVEQGEDPEECIAREMKEEMDLEIRGFRLFSVREFTDRIEYVFWQEANLDIREIRLTEGQCLRWFTSKEAREKQLAYGFNEIVEEFFEKAPFESTTVG
jgi:8-oxo-dGTP diphosphatase